MNGNQVEVTIWRLHGVKLALQIVHCFQGPQSVVEVVADGQCGYVSFDKLDSMGGVRAVSFDEVTGFHPREP